jgi:putative flavoprotein involved in K+ transport
MFAAASYWRDLVSFTWNLKTVENPDGVADLLTHNLDRVSPAEFELSEPAATADGVTEAWFTFTTSVGRGKGLVRLIDEDGTKAWTVLTALQELTGHEEPRGTRRPKGAVHGVDPERKSWSERLAEEDAAWGRTADPYILVVGGGQGGIALGARLRQLGVPAPRRRSVGEARGSVGALGTSRCACTTLCGTTTCPISSSPTTGRCSHPRTRSRTGWSSTRR